MFTQVCWSPIRVITVFVKFSCCLKTPGLLIKCPVSSLSVVYRKCPHEVQNKLFIHLSPDFRFQTFSLSLTRHIVFFTVVLLFAKPLWCYRPTKKQSSPATRHGSSWGRGGMAPTHSRPRHYMGVSSQRHAPAALFPGERTPGIHCTGGWVSPRAGLDTEVRGKILCLCRESNPDRPFVQSVVRHYTDWATPVFFP
jgi:hypothetical protein